MRYFIIGDGDKARRIKKIFKDLDIIGNISIKSQEKTNDVISIENYLDQYNDAFVIVAEGIIDENKTVDQLIKKGVNNYFILSDCPGEINEPNVREYLKEYVLNLIRRNTKEFCIYGCTLYSMLVREWIINTTGLEPYIIPHKGANPAIVRHLSKKVKLVTDKSNVQEIIGFNRTLLITVDRYELAQGVTDNKEFIDVFDCTDNISQYYNPRITRFHNIHNGEECVIVATGPSLRYEDLEVLNTLNVHTISMNRIWMAYNKTNWRPEYYVIQDHRYIQEDMEVLDTLDSKAVFVCDSCQEYIDREHPSNHFLFHTQFEYKKSTLPKFSTDFARKNYNGATVTYTCLQLAVYLGFKKIYLLGVDFNIVGNYSDAQNHFTDQYYKNKLPSPGFFRDENSMAFLSAKKFSEDNNIKIINITRGGKLEIFKRESFDYIFGGSK